MCPEAQGRHRKPPEKAAGKGAGSPVSARKCTSNELNFLITPIFQRPAKDSSRRIRSYPGVVRGLFASSGYVQTRGMPAEPEDLVLRRCIGSGRCTLSKGRRVVTPDLTFHVLTDDPLIHRQIVLDGAGIAILPLYMALESTMALSGLCASCRNGDQSRSCRALCTRLALV